MKGYLWKIILLVIVSFGIVFISLVCFIYGYSFKDEAQKADAIVVLGASQWSGEPSPVFKARLDHAYDLYTEEYAPVIILTGGVGDKEKLSEAFVGKNYLIGKGINKQVLFLEEEGRTSLQSLKNISATLGEYKIDSIILVSDGFHMMRLKKMADDLKIVNFVSPATNSPIDKNNFAKFKYIMREAVVFCLYRLFKI